MAAAAALKKQQARGNDGPTMVSTKAIDSTGQYALPRPRQSQLTLWMHYIDEKLERISSEDAVANIDEEEEFRVGPKEDRKPELQTQWLARVVGSIDKVGNSTDGETNQAPDNS